MRAAGGSPDAPARTLPARLLSARRGGALYIGIFTLWPLGRSLRRGRWRQRRGRDARHPARPVAVALELAAPCGTRSRPARSPTLVSVAARRDEWPSSSRSNERARQELALTFALLLPLLIPSADHGAGLDRADRPLLPPILRPAGGLREPARHDEPRSNLAQAPASCSSWASSCGAGLPRRARRGSRYDAARPRRGGADSEGPPARRHKTAHRVPPGHAAFDRRGGAGTSSRPSGISRRARRSSASPGR